MRRRAGGADKFRLALGSILLAAGLPVLAQDAPESLLPPGFGDPVPREAPVEANPSAPSRPPVGAPVRPEPGLVQTNLQEPAPLNAAANAAEAEVDEAEALKQQMKYDLPPTARRSLARVGPLTPRTGGLEPQAFGVANGEFLARVMRASHAPFASRWASILLRRALLTGADTPQGIDGADWVAERAWLLLRMGEANAARLLVQSVDPDRYTPRLYAVAMQAALAMGDPAGICPIAAEGAQVSDKPGWLLARAICASLSGDQGSASGFLNQAERRNDVRDIDYRLAEKIVGAGFNARRSVTIEWEPVDRLTTWRYGLATAANLAIPERLFDRVGPQVRVWQALSPMMSPARRQGGVAMAARLGVLSSAAFADYCADISGDPDISDAMQRRVDALRTASAGDGLGERMTGLRELWGDGAAPDYAGLVLSARAAAAIPPSAALAEDAPSLIASMLSAGYDRNAVRWSGVLDDMDAEAAARAWALLVLAAPNGDVRADGARFSAFKNADASAGNLATRMLAAGMAALGRISVEEAQKAAGDVGLVLDHRSRWTRAIDAAAARGEPGTVAVLAAIGLQSADWTGVPPEHLYHIVAALRRVGLEPEARMIAAEAVARTAGGTA